MTMTLTARDTRTAYRPPSGVTTRPAETTFRAGAGDETRFAVLVRDLIRAPHRGRASARARVITHLKSTRYPRVALNELLFECAHRGGPDGLDIAIDVLAEIGSEAAPYARRFVTTDRANWSPKGTRRRVTDDIWYALLRGVCRSAADPREKAVLLSAALFHGTVSIREAAVHATGDFADRDGAPWSDLAVAFLRKLIEVDPADEVKESAAEVLADLER